jgi:dipeptidyl aminopeptidase/acylaminoacyl peptidase
MKPIKAINSNVWLIKRESVRDAPNYFLTTDFKVYHRLTNIQPQNDYNWITSELHSWKQIDRSYTQGILYKPEDFNPKKKYPVIIFYYEQFSHRLNQFPNPQLSIGPIDIPWFVSRGYIVFTPDIYFTPGKNGYSTYNSVVSAAKYLSTLPFINSSKIGINGHSQGGFETNYLITHSKIFAAALSGAGVSDLVSSALAIDGYGSRLGPAENKMGATLWQRSDLYFENSPILRVEKVSTPLLILHCKDDYAVPWQQSLELFLALRRLQKPVWMLQYDNGGHVLFLQKDKLDYTIRITQFFDHYLKNAGTPKWMRNGLPARMKGTENGYELVN